MVLSLPSKVGRTHVRIPVLEGKGWGLLIFCGSDLPRQPSQFSQTPGFLVRIQVPPTDRFVSSDPWKSRWQTLNHFGDLGTVTRGKQSKTGHRQGLTEEYSSLLCGSIPGYVCHGLCCFAPQAEFVCVCVSLCVCVGGWRAEFSPYLLLWLHTNTSPQTRVLLLCPTVWGYVIWPCQSQAVFCSPHVNHVN